MSQRDYQNRAFDKLRDAINRGRKRILLCGPTGCGKGYMASQLIKGCAEKGNDSVFFADQRELVLQLKKHLDVLSIPSNVVMRGVKNEYDSYEADVSSRLVNLVAKDTIWSRAYRKTKMSLPAGGFIQVDEAHKSLSRTWLTILKDYLSSGSIIVGWTATPCRSDGRNLGEFWDELVQVATYKELQAGGFLVPCEVFAPSSPDLKGVGRSGGDYSMRDCDERIGKDGMIGDMISEWKRRSDGRQTVVFATTVRHSLACAEQFRRAGVTVEHVDGKMPQAALELGVKRIVFGECGHAWRVAYSFLNTLAGPFDFLDPRYPVPQHIIEVTYDLIQRGALTLDRSANDERRVTFHDSCNVARASRMGPMPGGQFVLPREVIKASCNHFFDMAPETIRESTFCCGGGGGLLTDDLVELRVKGAKPRMQALKEVSERHQITHMVAICAICKSQFSKVLPYYGFGMDQILSLHQLVGDAIVLGEEH